jgi:hypothetical protein
MFNRRLFWFVFLETTAIGIVFKGVKTTAAYHAMNAETGSFTHKLARAFVGSLP